MAGMSDYLENAALNHVLTATGYTSPNATLYLSLHKADPTDADTGTEVSATVDDTAYARQSITFGAASGGVATSTNAQTYGAVVYGSGAAPYAVMYLGIYDAATAGNLLFLVSIPTVTLNTAEVASFATGAVTVTGD